ncbi:MAG: (2Fe-2S)-binding protein [Burkholderiales bacterium]|nr:(2Fe-2S)-binding protein [Burkholderiales bacterium]
MNQKIPIEMIVNGNTIQAEIEPRRHLVDFLREDLGLKGPHLGCEQGACGACTVRVDGQIVRGCLYLAVQANGKVVDTVEGLTAQGVLTALQNAFLRRNAMQCGFCSSGMLLSAAELIEQRPEATREQVREWISGNYCRCTGYHSIVDAIMDALEAQREQTE